MSIHLWQSGSPSGVIQKIELNGSDRQELGKSVTSTQRFVVETGNRSLINGSVVLIVNGLVYNSNADQTDGSNTDFYIEDNVVIVNDPNNGGTIKIKDSDKLLIFYRA